LTTLLIGVSAGLGGLAAVLALLLVRGRRAPAPDVRVADVLATLNNRMDELGREVAAALQRTDEEGQRSRLLSELTLSIDLDEVLARTLEAAHGLRCADAAVISVRTPDEKPVVATIGLSEEEAQRQMTLTVGPPNTRSVHSVAVAYTYSDAETETDASVIHAGLAVPLQAESAELGYLIVFTRVPGRGFEEEDVDQLVALAVRAGPVIENAQRFREARQLADLDALTGLHNRRYFHETLAREVARAQRYDRRLALIVFDLDDFKEINDRIGHLAGDAVLAEAAERVRSVVRSADVACRVGGDEFAVILPESALVDADQLYRRIQNAVASRPIGQAGNLHLSAGVAELRRGDDPTGFFQRADEALYRAKEAGKGRAVAANSVG
jgi:diguanylate cyclase (GGDEF)-like protein